MRNCTILLLTLAPLTACMDGDRALLGGCPDGETCSSDAPHGLEFEGATLAGDPFQGLVGPSPTAVGGVQDIELALAPNDGDFEAPYSAITDGGPLAVDGQDADTVTVRGVVDGSAYLRIVDNNQQLDDRYLLQAESIGTVELTPTGDETADDGQPFVYATGDQDFGVALIGATTGARLVDTSMTLALAGSEREAWDELHVPSAVAGTQTIAITAAGKASTLPVEFVDHADSIEAQAKYLPLYTSGATEVCFSPINAGRYVIGFGDWAVTSDDADVAPISAQNCREITPQTLTTSVHVTVTAGGMQQTLELAIGKAPGTAAPLKARRPFRARPILGERAASGD